MKRRKQQFNVLERIESIKELLEPIIPSKNGRKIRGLLLQCVRYQQGRITTISPEARCILDIFLKNGYTVKTSYEWFLLEDVPSHIRHKLEQGVLGLTVARHQYIQWNRMVEEVDTAHLELLPKTERGTMPPQKKN